MEAQTAQKKLKPAFISGRKARERVYEGQHANVQSILHANRIQPKLRVGQPNDKYEQEADRVAEQVMRIPEPHFFSADGSPPGNDNPQSGTIQRACAACAKDEALIQAKVAIQRSSLIPETQFDSEIPSENEVGSEELEVSRKATANQLESANLERDVWTAMAGGGRSLPKITRDFMEQRMGHGFADVRIHTDPTAHDLARRTAARAFTVRNNVFFAPGEYRADTHDGKRLLAHELTHVVQQSASGEAVQREPLLIQRAAHPCPPHAEPDSSKDVEKFNCTGLAVRNYKYIGRAATNKLHKAMSPISCGTGCGKWGIKHWYWEYDLHAEDSKGNKGAVHRDFHTAGGMLDENGKDFSYIWSKNGARPVFGPASGSSWKPAAREQARKNDKSNALRFIGGQPLYVVRKNYSASCFCGSCPASP